MRTEDQRIGELALRTAQWYNASLYQFKRFLAAIETPTDGKEPWEQGETGSLLRAEAMFLITAIHQSIRYLEDLHGILQAKGDPSLKPLLDAVATAEERTQIRQWRNLTEHEREYIQGIGREQKRAHDPSAFVSNFFVGVTDGMIYMNGNTKEFYLGRIRIDRLLSRLKEKQPSLLEKTKEIFDAYYIPPRP